MSGRRLRGGFWADARPGSHVRRGVTVKPSAASLQEHARGRTRAKGIGGGVRAVLAGGVKVADRPSLAYVVLVHEQLQNPWISKLLFVPQVVIDPNSLRTSGDSVANSQGCPEETPVKRNWHGLWRVVERARRDEQWE